VEFEFDIRVRDEQRGGRKCQIHSTRSVKTRLPAAGVLRIGSGIIRPRRSPAGQPIDFVISLNRKHQLTCGLVVRDFADR
jgi:hypothetical protein